MTGQPDVLALARRAFIDTGRVDMGALAAAAGVNRSTVYRRFHGRDRLLGEVLWSIAEPALTDCIAQARGTGGVRIADALARFTAVAIGRGAFPDFLRRDPERALRLMTTRAGGFQHRLVDRVRELLDDEAAAGRLTLTMSPADTAFLLVRITESFVYTDAITGEEPDPSKVRQACRALLGVT